MGRTSRKSRSFPSLSKSVKLRMKRLRLRKLLEVEHTAPNQNEIADSEM